MVFVVSQVTKAQSRRIKDGELLDSVSGQSISDQKANLVMTLNPVFTENHERLEEGYIYCAKNSLGPTPARLRVKTALNRHRWTESVVSELETGDNASNGKSDSDLPWYHD